MNYIPFAIELITIKSLIIIFRFIYIIPKSSIIIIYGVRRHLFFVCTKWLFSFYQIGLSIWWVLWWNQGWFVCLNFIFISINHILHILNFFNTYRNSFWFIFINLCLLKLFRFMIYRFLILLFNLVTGFLVRFNFS